MPASRQVWLNFGKFKVLVDNAACFNYLLFYQISIDNYLYTVGFVQLLTELDTVADYRIICSLINGTVGTQIHAN